MISLTFLASINFFPSGRFLGRFFSAAWTSPNPEVPIITGFNTPNNDLCIVTVNAATCNQNVPKLRFSSWIKRTIPESLISDRFSNYKPIEFAVFQ